MVAAAWGYAVARTDGSPIFYESWGTRDRTLAPVVLCDGIGCDGYVWRFLRDDLDGRFALHPHYRGHGRTAAPRDVGHSMGVQVALETFARHRNRVSGLVLVCGAPSHPLKTFRGSAQLEQILPTVEKWVRRIPNVINRVTRWVLPTRLSYEIASRFEIRRELIDPADFMPYLEGVARIDARLFVTMLSAAGQHSADDLLPDIDVPTLVIAGQRDGFTPPERSRTMAAAIPASELLEIPNGSHTAPLERPHLVDWAIRDFIARRIDLTSGAATGLVAGEESG